MGTIDTWKTKLFIAKRLFEHSEGHLTPSTQINRLVAVIGYESSVELVLKSIADKYGIQPKKKYFTINELLSEIENRPSAAQGRPIRKADILKVAELRNIAIHHGTPPSEEAVAECRDYTRQFLCEASRTFFNLNFLSLTMIDFIQSEKAKQLLRIAEANLEAESFFHSRVPAKLALQFYLENYMALMPYGPQFKYYNAESTIQFAKKNELNDSERVIAYALNELHKAVSDEIEETRALLGIATLGYSLERLKKYDSIASRISFRIGAVSIPSATGTKNTSAEIELSKWFIAFIIELILQMEQSGVSGEPIDHLIKWYDLVIEKEGKVFT